MALTTSDSAHSSELADTPWAPITLINYPFQGIVPEDPVALVSEEMVIIHNALIRSLNAIWHNSAIVSQKDTPAFVNYSLVVLAAIHSHHDTEEDVMFPAFVAAGLDMEGNKEQHRAFHAGMEVFENYLEQVKRNELPYDAATIRELLKDFAGPLVQHLHDEIPTIAPEILGRLDKAVLDNFVKDLDAHIKRAGGLTTTIPCVLGGHKAQDAPDWPPIPPFVRWIARNIFSRVNASYWKFAPFTQTGEPQVYRP